MTPTETLFTLAEQEGIAVEWFNFEGVNGVYISGTELAKPIIGLDQSLRHNERLLRCTLAHELGHHFRTAGQQAVFASFKTSMSYNKLELLADKWALSVLFPTTIFLEKLSTGMDILSLADFFWVTEDYVHKQLKQMLISSFI